VDEYSSNQFSKITGIARKTLRVWRTKGWLLPRVEGNAIYYNMKHFENSRVAEAMARNGKQLPDETAEPPPAPALAPPPPPAMPEPDWETLSWEDVALLPAEQPIPPDLPPLKHLTVTGCRIWQATLPTICGRLTPASLATLADYCATMALAQHLTRQLEVSGTVTATGKPSPILNAIAKERAEARQLAAVLEITPQSRKNIKRVEKKEPSWVDDLEAQRPAGLARPETEEESAAKWEKLLADPPIRAV